MKVTGHSTRRAWRLSTVQVRQLHRFGLDQGTESSVSNPDMMVHGLSTTNKLAAQDAVAGEKATSSSFTEQVRPLALLDQSQQSGTKLTILDGVNLLLGELHVGTREVHRCHFGISLWERRHWSSLSMLHVSRLASTLDMNVKTTPCREGSMTQGALWQAIYHVLGYIGDVPTKAGYTMGHREMSA